MARFNARFISKTQHVQNKRRRLTSCRNSTSTSRSYFPACGRVAIVKDNESYFTLKNANVHGNDQVWTRDVSMCPPEICFQGKAKIRNFLPMSQSQSKEYCSVPANNTINAKVYCQIIHANIIPFMRQHHSNGSYYFWAD